MNQDETKLFEQQAKESTKAYEAFSNYLSLGPTRSLAAVGQKLGKSKVLMERWSKWVTLAAHQGDKRGQADLADMYLQGFFVKPDLLEAYKWGELAARGSLLDTATISGRSARDTAILKLSSEQIAEAKKRVAAFAPHQPGKNEIPEPSWVKQIKLSGLSGPTSRRLALINGMTFSQGEAASVKISGRIVKLRCLEIREKTVLVEVEDASQSREILLAAP